MIKVKPKLDGSNNFTFECSTQDELSFMKECHEKVLDRLVQIHFKNAGNLSIKKWADYTSFMHASAKEVLEMYYGRFFRYSDIGETEVKDALIIQRELSKRMSLTTATESLQELANSMYSLCKFKSSKKEEVNDG